MARTPAIRLFSASALRAVDPLLPLLAESFGTTAGGASAVITAFAVAYGARPKYGPDYIIPVPFDPRLILRIAPEVAKAAMASGVASRPIIDAVSPAGGLALGHIALSLYVLVSSFRRSKGEEAPSQ